MSLVAITFVEVTEAGQCLYDFKLLEVSQKLLDII